MLHDPDYTGKERLGIVDFLVENAMYRGYRKFGTVVVEYVFGEKGVLVQVSDKGKGFDPKPIIEAAQNSAMKKRVHFKGNGWAFKAMARPEFEAVVESALGKGTTVTVFYKYSQNNLPYIK